MRRTWGLGLGLCLVVASVGACGGKSERSGRLTSSAGVGDACVPSSEWQRSFSGFSETEVNLEFGSNQCETGLCLVNHFRGRVSCPYGQTEGDVADLNVADWGNRCRLPGTDGTRPEDRVSVPVQSQNYARRAEQAVYCSCRCANGEGNTDDGGTYCACPSGFSCEHLVDDVGLGGSEIAGSYCVAAGTEYDEAATEGSPNCTLDFDYPGGASGHPYYCGDAIPEYTGDPPGPDTTPTTNVFVDRISVSSLERIDLLFMIDNSISMADKQEVLALAVPQLVGRLVDPICVEPETGPCGDYSSMDGCDCGQAEFRAVDDIHIGIVTSSLGGHGGTLCTPDHGPTYWNETQNDGGRLSSRGGDGSVVPTWGDAGFLSWDPANSARNPDVTIPGIAASATLTSQFTNLVTGAGERGCGYEASLEAWYRFLIDPEPPADVVLNSSTMMSEPVGIDEALLAQRAQFLRPDSMVAIVMLSDENDCSVQDYGFGYLHNDTTEGSMPRSTSACDTNPNDPCCLSCIQANWPDGCADPQNDPKCQAGLFHEAADDRLNLRCYNQKQRFGLNFLYPISRYVNGLQSQQVPRQDGSMAPNPLYSVSNHPLAAGYSDLPPRLDSSRVFLAGIIGVPWQDLATDATLNDPSALEYLSALELSQQGIWEDVLGYPEASPPALPNDPFMIEQVAPRPTGAVNPRTFIAIEEPRDGSGGNAINGHEYTINNNGDLQYACIFPLSTPKECVDTPPGVGCDCKATPDILQRPLCDGTTQSFAKAYPGTRFLQVLRDYGQNSIVASICPKNTTSEPTHPAFGYNPAMAAIVGRLGEALQGSCLPRQLATDDSGNLLCQVVEVTRAADPAPCDGNPGRAAVEPAVSQAVLNRMSSLGMCGGAAGSCDDFSLCGLTRVDDDHLHNCLNQDDANLSGTGYCYIDAMTDINGDGVVQCQVAGDQDCLGNPALIASCPATERRLLRFANPPNAAMPFPWPSATIFVACQGEAF